MPKLSSRAVESAKPGDKPKKLYDENGLFLYIATKGTKYWRFRYKWEGKSRELSLGPYPLLSLSEARKRRDKERLLLINGIEPGAEKREAKAEAKAAAGDTFKAVSLEWMEVRMADKVEAHQRKQHRRLEQYLWPTLGDRQIADLTAQDFLAMLRPIEAADKIETAHRCLSIAGQVMRFAVATGRIQGDPTSALKGALRTPQVKHMAAPTDDPRLVGSILRRLDDYDGGVVVKSASRLSPLLFCRPGEIRQMRWADVDLDGDQPTWIFSPEKQRKGKDQKHIVPLARQAVEILRQLKPITMASEYVFPSPRSLDRPLSNMGVSAALSAIGVTKDQLVPHGWRAVARTMLHERLNYAPEVIEAQLAHKVRDALGNAYNRTQFLDKRREMMQAWADFLDELKIH